MNIPSITVLCAFLLCGGYAQAKEKKDETKQVARYPYGIPITGKPGFAWSPYLHKPVDVRGMPKHSEARDPYTNKVFLVP